MRHAVGVGSGGDEHGRPQRDDAFVHRHAAVCDRGAGRGDGANPVVAGGVGGAFDLHRAGEVQRVAGLHEQIAAAVAVLHDRGNGIARLRLLDEGADVGVLGDAGIVLLGDRLTRDQLAVGVNDLIDHLARTVHALLPDLRLTLGDLIALGVDRGVLRRLGERLVVGEARGDLNEDLRLAHVDLDHLHRADRDAHAL